MQNESHTNGDLPHRLEYEPQKRERLGVVAVLAMASTFTVVLVPFYSWFFPVLNGEDRTAAIVSRSAVVCSIVLGRIGTGRGSQRSRDWSRFAMRMGLFFLVFLLSVALVSRINR